MLLQKTTRIAYAAIFTAVFILIGWREINPYGFPDLDAYRVGFQSRWYLFTTLNLSPIEFALAEGLWIRGFDQLYALVGDIDTAFALVSTAAILLTSLFVVTRTRSPFYLIFFFNPAFIELTIGQIRSGLAAGIFWCAMNVKQGPVRLALMLTACLIHTAFFLFLAVYLAFFLFHQTEPVERLLRRPWISSAFLVLLAFLVTSIRGVVLAFFGDERAYQFLEYTSGIMLSLAWFSFILSYIFWRRESKISFEALFYMFCSSMFFFSALSGVYGSRFVSVSIPALAVMCSQLLPQYRPLFVAQFVAFSGIYFFYWFV